MTPRTSLIKTSPEQLAINGGTPAFSSPIHVGRPNVADPQRFMSLVQETLDRSWLTNDGPLVRQFEQLVASHVGVGHCVAMNNGTVAMQCLIRALGLSGEVIVPSFTFIATAHALEWMGVTPVFADIDAETHNLDPESVEDRITSRTSAIIPVHLWGRPADVVAFEQLSHRTGLPVVYDAAHAFSVTRGGRSVGQFGRAEVLSFHATKFMNSLEGGAVVTDDAELADELRRLRNFGFAGIDDVRSPGTNAKMIEAAAAMGITNMEAVDQLVDRNRQNYVAYQEALRDVPGMTLIAFDDTERNNFQYVVGVMSADRRHDRDRTVAALRAENVLARRYFWPGCHRMQHYEEWSHGALPVTEDISERVVVLPTGSDVGDAEIELIASIVSTSLRS